MSSVSKSAYADVVHHLVDAAAAMRKAGDAAQMAGDLELFRRLHDEWSNVVAMQGDAMRRFAQWGADEWGADK